MLIWILALLSSFLFSFGAPLPDGFVYLSDIDDSIIQEIRYAGYHNFVGEPVRFYHQPLCILTTQAAKQLSLAQAILKSKGLSLKVYDCYRPATSVAHFVEWAKDIRNTTMKEEFYPRVDKENLFEEGYIAYRSGHSQGSTVDITIVNTTQLDQPVYEPGDPLLPCTSSNRFKDNSLDFGTGFDCFDVKSHTAHPNFPPEILRRRADFVSLMKQVGFRNYAKEWWHFTLVGEPFNVPFDFPIE